MLRVKPASVEINGKNYELELGTVSSTHLGIEDHGLFTVSIMFDFGGSSQGLGHRMMGQDAEATGPFLKELLPIFKATTWEELKGKKVFVIRDGSKYTSTIAGLVDVDQSKYIVFDDFFRNLNS